MAPLLRSTDEYTTIMSEDQLNDSNRLDDADRPDARVLPSALTAVDQHCHEPEMSLLHRPTTFGLLCLEGFPRTERAAPMLQGKDLKL
jgi:hypothetical protein